MRIGIDFTAAARQGGGIGRCTRELVGAILAEHPPHDFALLAGVAGLGSAWGVQAERLRAVAAPGRLRLVPIPLTDDWMARIWHRLRAPLPATLLTGPLDLFYAPDFLLPPLPRDVRTWVTIHDLSFLRHPETFPAKLRSYLERAVPRSVGRADRVLTDSDATRRDVIDLLGITPERVTTVLLGVSDAFGPISAAGEREALLAKHGVSNRPYILAVGTVQPRKNYARLIEIVDLVRTSVDVDLVIAGQPAWLAEPVLDAAATRGHVRILGFVDDADLPALYRQAAVLAFPSLYEGFGLPPLEAMACGVPVVASSASSVPEAVGDAGLLLNPLDVPAWADALSAVLTDGGLRADLIARGLARAATFTWARPARQWLSLLEGDR
ncbi:MAG: glycosyltransferase family 4 protein [Anaerolineae bacterium]|nr:glycosyltransferase family 4 protein [Anaerolineae bacterium]